MKTEHKRSFCVIIQGNNKDKVAKTRYNKCIGLLFALSLSINAAHAGWLDFIWGSGQPEQKVVPALVCKYLDQDYSNQVPNPVIVFGPNEYTLKSAANRKFFYKNSSGFTVYNNLFTALKPMSLVESRIGQLVVNGEVERPHHKHIKGLIKRETEIINTTWSLKQKLFCEPKPALVDKIFPEHKVKPEDKQLPNPEIWSLSRGGMHRDLQLLCVWQMLKLPLGKTTHGDSAKQQEHSVNYTVDNYDPSGNYEVVNPDKPKKTTEQKTAAPSNFEVEKDYDPKHNYSLVEEGDLPKECELTVMHGKFDNFVNEEDD
ncbi:MAG: hypothetical protein K0R14_1657 [Burkholderiales bacterium]|jgi:hypothetical protein|nr:hypothetical protein [Burkholderiales bacterium]